MDDESGSPDALERVLTVTRFTSHAASTKKEVAITLRDLAPAILKRTAPKKDALPWLKLARFGDRKTEKGSLRHDANVLAVDGVEADYDGGEVGVEEAIARLKAARLAALVYTSPSHTPEAPRWRVLAPFSKSLAPEKRRHMAERLNGALGGILAGESFALSQAYFYGSVAGNPAHRVELVEGRALDLAHDLDAGAVGKGSKPPKGGEAGGHVAPLRRPKDESRSGVAFRLACDLARDGKGEAEWRDHPDVAPWAAEKPEREVARTWARAAARVEPERAWLATLMTVGEEEKRRAVPCLENAVVTLRLHPDWADVLAFDAMAQTVVKLRPLPTHDGDGLDRAPYAVPEPWEEADTTAARRWIQRIRLMVSREDMREAVEFVARDHRFHPVRDYLDGLRWDGTPRLANLMHAYAGAKADPYAQGIGRMFLISLVARAYEPGCEVHHMPALIGAQGAGKSSFCKALMPRREWFSDTLPPVGEDSVRTAMALRGKWLIEVAELDAFRRTDFRTLKDFLTRAVEEFTPKYGRQPVREPRGLAFIGTTNESEFLKDDTGNRRFWPLEVGTPDLDALRRDRDQLWAEAATAYRAGEAWHPTRRWQEIYATPAQEAAREEVDARIPLVRAWLDGERSQYGEDAERRDRVTAAQVWTEALDGRGSHFPRADQMAVAKMLKALGWEKRKVRYGDKTLWTYFRPDPAADI
ncbi:virulence-associated E family protein [Muricoccus roseus]|uniref:virulence-associated E family protein n=1 Tax=Muricoccus roseus TaxID=198092 RepID=UPI00158825A7|nr:virulence-associated E family protein [Roseomonas rosea]